MDILLSIFSLSNTNFINQGSKNKLKEECLDRNKLSSL